MPVELVQLQNSNIRLAGRTGIGETYPTSERSGSDYESDSIDTASSGRSPRTATPDLAPVLVLHPGGESSLAWPFDGAGRPTGPPLDATPHCAERLVADRYSAERLVRTAVSSLGAAGAEAQSAAILREVRRLRLAPADQFAFIERCANAERETAQRCEIRRVCEELDASRSAVAAGVRAVSVSLSGAGIGALGSIVHSHGAVVLPFMVMSAAVCVGSTVTFRTRVLQMAAQQAEAARFAKLAASHHDVAARLRAREEV